MAMTLWREAPDGADGAGCSGATRPEAEEAGAMDASGEDRRELAEEAGAARPAVV